MATPDQSSGPLEAPEHSSEAAPLETHLAKLLDEALLLVGAPVFVALGYPEPSKFPEDSYGTRKFKVGGRLCAVMLSSRAEEPEKLLLFIEAIPTITVYKDDAFSITRLQ